MTFVKGQSGNPDGRPPGAKNFTTKVREALEKIAEGKDYTYEEALIKSIMKKAIVDGDSATQRLMWNYLDGLPHQTTDITSAGKPIPILNVSTNNSNGKDSEDVQEDQGGTGGNVSE